MSEFKPGDVFYATKPTSNGPETKKCYVLAVVDEDRVVYKWWARFSRRWMYDVEQACLLNLCVDKPTKQEGVKWFSKSG